MAFIRNGIILALDQHEVFVFGSNVAGRHGAGAARYALRAFGAVYGVGEGLTGQCYALPTKGSSLLVRSPEAIIASLQKLAAAAEQLPDRTFLLSRIGQGLCGYSQADVLAMLAAAPMPGNVLRWERWEHGNGRTDTLRLQHEALRIVKGANGQSEYCSVQTDTNKPVAHGQA